MTCRDETRNPAHWRRLPRPRAHAALAAMEVELLHETFATAFSTFGHGAPRCNVCACSWEEGAWGFKPKCVGAFRWPIFFPDLGILGRKLWCNRWCDCKGRVDRLGACSYRLSTRRVLEGLPLGDLECGDPLHELCLCLRLQLNRCILRLDLEAEATFVLEGRSHTTEQDANFLRFLDCACLGAVGQVAEDAMLDVVPSPDPDSARWLALHSALEQPALLLSFLYSTWRCTRPCVRCLTQIRDCRFRVVI